MEHIRNILDGFSSIFAGFDPRFYEPYSGFKGDNDRLREDVRIVGDDFKKAGKGIYGKASTGSRKKQ